MNAEKNETIEETRTRLATMDVAEQGEALFDLLNELLEDDRYILAIRTADEEEVEAAVFGEDAYGKVFGECLVEVWDISTAEVALTISIGQLNAWIQDDDLCRLDVWLFRILAAWADLRSEYHPPIGSPQVAWERLKVRNQAVGERYFEAIEWMFEEIGMSEEVEQEHRALKERLYAEEYLWYLERGDVEGAVVRYQSRGTTHRAPTSSHPDGCPGLFVEIRIGMDALNMGEASDKLQDRLLHHGGSNGLAMLLWLVRHSGEFDKSRASWFISEKLFAIGAACDENVERGWQEADGSFTFLQEIDWTSFSALLDYVRDEHMGQVAGMWKDRLGRILAFGRAAFVADFIRLFGARLKLVDEGVVEIPLEVAQAAYEMAMWGERYGIVMGLVTHFGLAVSPRALWTTYDQAMKALIKLMIKDERVLSLDFYERITL